MKSILVAEKAAASRAMEMMFPEALRLYEDQVSIRFLTGINRFFIWIMKYESVRRWMIDLMDKVGEGIYGGIISRTRYIDDVLEAAIRNGFDAVVNLGGGYDTRCLRFDMKGIPYYHIDQQPVINGFRKIMTKFPSGVPSNIRFISIDFNNQSLEDELAKAGYDKSMKTLFLWEGVTQYITEVAMIGTLDYIASTAKGSQVVFTYVLKGLLENLESFPEYKGVVKQIKMTGAEWLTGIEPNDISDFLTEHGFSLTEDVGAEDYKVRYFEPIGREMVIMPIERIALAEVLDQHP